MRRSNKAGVQDLNFAEFIKAISVYNTDGIVGTGFRHTLHTLLKHNHNEFRCPLLVLSTTACQHKMNRNVWHDTLVGSSWGSVEKIIH